MFVRLMTAGNEEVRITTSVVNYKPRIEPRACHRKLEGGTARVASTWTTKEALPRLLLLTIERVFPKHVEKPA